MMTQPDRPPVAPLRRVRANDWGPMGGPLLPGEFRPIAPVPASSDPGNPPPFSEQEAIRVLILHYGWCPIGGNELRRYRRHGSKLEVLEGGRSDG